MAKSRMPKEKSKGKRPDEVKDGQDCPPSKTAGHPGSYEDVDDAKKLSEAVGGIPAADNESTFLPGDIKEGDVVDTKSGSRPSSNVYRCLSQNTGEDSEICKTAHHDEDPHTCKEKFNFSLISKSNTLPTWDSSPPGGIRLGATASFENRSKSKSEQRNVRLYQTASGDAPVERSGDQKTYTCTDAGGADSAISGSTEDQSYSENVPFPVLSNDQQKEYKRKYADLRKKVKTDHKQRMILRTESDCLPDSCFHPEHKYDWSNHSMKKMEVYNYTVSRTGHIFQRGRNTNCYKECGTCCHIGDGYVLTCYHCIKETLWKDGWEYEWRLQNDLTVTFPDVSTCTSRPGRRTLQYRFEPNLYAHSENLDFALLKLDQRNYEQIPPHFTRHTKVNGDQEHPVYIAGYQLHPKHMYGKLVVDASALKFPCQALNLQFVEVWSKKLKERFQASIEKRYNGICPWKGTYYPITRCRQYFPVLSSLIAGASGGFGLTYSAQDDQLPPVVNFLYRGGYPEFYYNSHFADSSCPDVRNKFLPCWTFQEGVPIGPIVEEIRKSPDKSLHTIPFLLSNV